MSSLYSIGAMNQLGDSLEAAGFSADHVTKLKQYKELEKIKLLLDGCAEIVQIKHIIDCNAEPFLPDGWKVEIHCHGGRFEWNVEKVSLYLSEQQKNGKIIVGNELRKELESLETLNANVLDYLLKNPQLISEDWKDKAIFFWGTIYRDSRDLLCVRYLYWEVKQWYWHFGFLDDGLSERSPAILLASS